MIGPTPISECSYCERGLYRTTEIFEADERHFCSGDCALSYFIEVLATVNAEMQNSVTS